jgi:hypothetical protein
LIQREIERSGIPTIGISIMRRFTEKVKPPRSIHLYWPYGHPLGEPFMVGQQAAVLGRAFDAFSQITEPGTIIDVMFKWHREQYPRAPWLERPDAIEAARNNPVIPGGACGRYRSTNSGCGEGRRACIQ